MRIALDIDDVLARFMQAYCDKFETDKYPKRLESKIITKNVHRKLMYDKGFWLSLEVKHRPNFVPELYCTKRVNPKEYTKKWLEINGFPKRPVYQMIYQKGNKATMIKGRCDVLIDDSVSNVLKAMASGLPAILMDDDYNQHSDYPYRIHSLDIAEITSVYEDLINNEFKGN